MGNKGKNVLAEEFQREIKTTLKVLRAYSQKKQDLIPADKLRSMKDLTWVLFIDLMLTSQALDGKIDWEKMHAVPASLKEIIAALEKEGKSLNEKLKKVSEEQFSKSKVDFFAGPGKMDKIPVQAVCWIAFKDHIYHRGRISVYFRIAGGEKLPSIYGLTADEPWM
jgi:uncharacterized damage-inducible protein DinB